MKSNGDRNRDSNQDHDRSGSAENLLEHISESYDFVWNAKRNSLEDSKDSIIYGQLVVSPPPSG